MIRKMSDQLLSVAKGAKGFMPEDEGQALYEAAFEAAVGVPGPLVEIGSYCGKSAVYVGAAAREAGRVLFSVDHHRGSEENQAGWEHYDPSIVDPDTGLIDTLPFFRKTISAAGLHDFVVPVVGDSITVAANWSTPLCFLFIDGGHGEEPAWNDYRSWSRKVAPGGTLAIHDVFENPADGGRPPYEIYREAISSREFEETSERGSLRILRRLG